MYFYFCRDNLMYMYLYALAFIYGHISVYVQVYLCVHMYSHMDIYVHILACVLFPKLAFYYSPPFIYIFHLFSRY